MCDSTCQVNLNHIEVAGTQIGRLPILRIWCRRQIEEWWSVGLLQASR